MPYECKENSNGAAGGLIGALTTFVETKSSHVKVLAPSCENKENNGLGAGGGKEESMMEEEKNEGKGAKSNV